MPRFAYQVTDSDHRLATGELEAESVAAAIRHLEGQGLTVQWIGLTTATESGQATSGRKPSESTSDRVDDESLLQTHLERALQRAGELAGPLRVYATEFESGRDRTCVADVCAALDHRDVRRARESFERSPEYWIPLFGGPGDQRNAAQLLQDVVAKSRRFDRSRRQWRTFLAYPAFLVGFALLVFVALARIVVPTFRAIFDDFDLQLPWITRWTLAVSEWLSSGYLLLGVVAALAGIVAAGKLAGPWVARRLGMRIGRAVTLAMAARATSDVLSAGVPWPDALRLIAPIAMSGEAGQSIRRLALCVDGFDGTDATSLRRRLSNSFVYAATTDMSPTARISLLRAIGECYFERSQATVSWSQSWLGPMTIFVVGGVVAVVTLSLFLPLVSLVNNLTG